MENMEIIYTIANRVPFILLEEDADTLIVINKASEIKKLETSIFDEESIQEVKLSQLLEQGFNSSISHAVKTYESNVEISNLVKNNKPVTISKKVINFNRIYADISELLLIKKISKEANIKFMYKNELLALSNQAKEQDTSFNEHYLAQDKNTDKGALAFLKKYGKDISSIEWTGRENHSSTDDIKIIYTNKSIRKISLKSISSNSIGTLKNIGLGKNGQFSHFFNDKIINFYDDYKKNIKKNYSFTILKNAKGNIEVKKEGKKFQKKLTAMILSNFKNLNKEQKLNLTKLLCDYDNEIINIEVNPFASNCYMIKEKVKLSEKSDITFKAISENSIILQLEKKDLIRIQVNSTNGIGISPFCLRCFWV